MKKPDLDSQVKALEAQMSKCTLCPRKCGCDRTFGHLGYCRTDHRIGVAYVGLHFGEEPPISGTRGSGTIFFSHCNLACVFCQNYQISQTPDTTQLRYMTPAELSSEMLNLQAQGAHNINLVSPTHVIAPVARALLIARQKGLTLPIVYNSNGYDSTETIALLHGLVDIYLPDCKYHADPPAKQYSDAFDYAAHNRAAIQAMFSQAGHLSYDEDGMAVSGLLVRHLILPNDLSGTSDCLAFLAGISIDLTISLMAQYSPQYQAAQFSELNRRITESEYDALTSEAWELGLDNCFIQELGSQDHYVPDFTKSTPFSEG